MQRELKGSTQIRLLLDGLLFLSGGIILLMLLIDGAWNLPLKSEYIVHPLRVFAGSFFLRWLLDAWLDRKMASYPFWNALLNDRGWHYTIFGVVLLLCLRAALQVEMEASLLLIFATVFILWLGLINLYEMLVTLGASTCRSFFIALALFFGSGIFLTATLNSAEYLHAMNFAFCAAYIHFTVRWSRNARGNFKWLVLGIFSGLAALVHLPNLLLLPLAPLLAKLAAKDLEKNELEFSKPLFIKQISIYAGAVLFAFQPRIIIWLLTLMSDLEIEKQTSIGLQNPFLLLLFAWPLIIVALFGFKRFCQVHCPLASCLIIFFGATIILGMLGNSPIENSLQLFFNSIPFFAIGLHFLYDNLRKKTASIHRLVGISIAILTLWTFCANVQYLNHNNPKIPINATLATGLKTQLEFRWQTIQKHFL